MMFEYVSSPSGERDMSTRTRNERRRAGDDDGLSSDETTIEDYSLTDDESNSVLEIPLT